MSEFKPSKPVFTLVSKEKDHNDKNISLGAIFYNQSESGKKYFGLKLSSGDTGYFNIGDKGLQNLILDYVNNNSEILEPKDKNETNNPSNNSHASVFKKLGDPIDDKVDPRSEQPHYDRYGNLIQDF